MAFVKLYKNNAYFKRFQTQFRRRREGKTDYYARKRLVSQEKSKYNTRKYRFVVRTTCSKVLCQVVYSQLTGDKVLCQAQSTELKKYGLTSSLTNYAAAYATGLLLARRLLTQTSLNKLYPGQATVDGEYYSVEENVNERRPFKAILDVGLTYTTVGNRIFGALKGATDGGLYVPHNTKRFPGYTKDGDSTSYDAKVHRDRIFGVHVDNYMKSLKEDSPEDFALQFSKVDACLKAAKVATLEALFTKIHAEIKKNPAPVKKAAAVNPKRDHKKFKQVRLTHQQRKDNVTKKFQIAEANK